MDAILLRGVRTHNLKNFDLVLPHRKFYVITGVSGSGKSSLAFDTLYAEGQRRYVESLSAYARQFLERMEKPDLEGITGILPAIAIEAKNVITNARSTVGTQTEINDYLRLLFARIGRTHCDRCGKEVVKETPGSVAEKLLTFPSLILSPPKGGEDKGEGGISYVTILFPVSFGPGARRYWKEFVPELSRQGFTEIFDGRKQRLLSEFKPGAKSQKIWVVADRLKSEAKQRKRMIDSLELAFARGKGEAGVLLDDGVLLSFSDRFRCDPCGLDYKEPVPNLFSFNSPLGACSQCQGFGRVITIDWDRVVPDPRRSIEGGAVFPWSKPGCHWEFRQLLRFCRNQKIPVEVPWKNLSARHRRWILEGSGKREDKYFSVQDFFKHLEKKTYKMHVRVFLSRFRSFVTCPGCSGRRLKREALGVRISGQNIADLCLVPLGKLGEFFNHLKLTAEDATGSARGSGAVSARGYKPRADGRAKRGPLTPAEAEKVEPVLLEIRKRLRFLNEVGLSYLTLDRLSRTLSGGEVERIHLATSLGSSLVDTLYVLDEPSIGLHERDNQLLIRLLKELRDLGNTVVVVEHDRTMIEAADEVIDLGPLGGEKGGELLFQGKVENLRREPRSLTGKYLAGELKIAWRHRPPLNSPAGWRIRIQGATQHNLRSVDIEIPLGKFVVVTGVSGSGKSTLIYDVLYQNYQKWRGRPVQDLGAVEKISGFESVDEVMLVDQSPVGRTPRSNPATYLKAFEEIRKVFGTSEAARRAGFTPRHFSFNVEGGRCETCKGDGRIKVEMHFLADVFLPCETCQGKRFKPEILDIRILGKNIDEVLQMTIDAAASFFGDRPRRQCAETARRQQNGWFCCQRPLLKEKLAVLQKVGLGYLRLGQPAPTLSGGEAQRLKLAHEMADRSYQKILYLFDEPTTGLHAHDISYLMEAFEELLAEGHSVVVIEHNLEVIQCADWILDLGPEGGDGGGRVVYSGPREGILECPASHTGRYLKQHLNTLRAPNETSSF